MSHHDRPLPSPRPRSHHHLHLHGDGPVHRLAPEAYRRAADRLHDHTAVDDLDRIDESDRLVLLRAGLDASNPRYQRALVLRHLSGLEHEEAARARGVTPALMAVIVHRATAALRRAIEKLEGT